MHAAWEGYSDHGSTIRHAFTTAKIESFWIGSDEVWYRVHSFSIGARSSFAFPQFKSFKALSLRGHGVVTGRFYWQGIASVELPWISQTMNIWTDSYHTLSSFVSVKPSILKSDITKQWSLFPDLIAVISSLSNSFKLESDKTESILRKARNADILSSEIIWSSPYFTYESTYLFPSSVTKLFIWSMSPIRN